MGGPAPSEVAFYVKDPGDVGDGQCQAQVGRSQLLSQSPLRVML